MVTAQRNGDFIVPWGCFGDVPDHIKKGLTSEVEGGSGAAERFWHWCEKETASYAGGQEFVPP